MKIALGLIGGLLAAEAVAHEVSQKVGSYQGSDGESRIAGSLSGAIERGPIGTSGISSASYSFEGSVERIKYEDISKDDYMQEYFPAAAREQQTVSIGTTHTYEKLTDVRLGGAYSTDSISSSRSWNTGLGRWWRQDSIQTNVDYSQTLTDRPSDSILDGDFQSINLGPKVSSRGVTLSFKHLATPTTIWGSSYTRVVSTARPRLDAYAGTIKQYIPAWRAAVHGSAARLINTGSVSDETNLGSLAGIQGEVAFLKELWSGAASRASYRYVREDEHTRAFGNHLIYGADSYSLGVTQDFKKGTLATRPVTTHAVVTRSISNSELGATIGEAGLSTKF